MSFAHFNSRRSKRTPAYFFLQINQSSLLKLLSMESGHPNYPRVKKIFLQKWNRKRKRVGKRICLIPKQLSIYLNPTLSPTIYLLLSESYGSALAGKADLSFQLWNTNCIWLAVAEGLKTGNGKGPILSECLVAVSLYKSIAAGLLWVVSRKNQNHRRAVQSLSYHTIKSRSAVGSKKNSGKKRL